MKKKKVLGLFVLLAVMIFTSVFRQCNLDNVDRSKPGLCDRRCCCGWKVLEYKDAVNYNDNDVWTTVGVTGGGTSQNGSSVMWFYNPAVVPRYFLR